MTRLGCRNVIVLSVLPVTYHFQNDNIGDSTRHDKLRTVVHELESGRQVIELERGESLVDDTGVVDLELVSTP